MQQSGSFTLEVVEQCHGLYGYLTVSLLCGLTAKHGMVDDKNKIVTSITIILILLPGLDQIHKGKQSKQYKLTVEIQIGKL
jgi:hypothetical protein